MTILMLCAIAVGAIFLSSVVLHLYGVLGRLNAGERRLLWYMLMIPLVVAPGFAILGAAFGFAKAIGFQPSGFTVAFWSALLPPLFLWAGVVFAQVRLLNRRHDRGLFA